MMNNPNGYPYQYMNRANNTSGVSPMMQNMTMQPQPRQQVPNWNMPYITTYPTIPGRLVTNPEEIRPNEVPMDGTVSFFPSNDYSCIYAKVWGNDGMLKTFKYIPEPPPEQKEDKPAQQAQPADFSPIMSRLDTIEQAILTLANRQASNKPKYNNQKKENVENG